MKLSDQFMRKPFHVAFSQALSGSITSIDLAAVRDASTVTITASDGSVAPIAGADASNAGMLTAVDKVKLDGLSGGSGPAPQDFAARTDVALATIDAAITHLRTAGYSAVGDGGAALYKRAGTEPTHALKVQSADLAWWELVPDSHGYINVRQAGATGDNVTNDGQSFIDALSFASLNAGSNDNATYGVIVPPSNTPYYLGANTLELKATVHLVGQGSGQAGGNPCQLRWDANVTGIIVHRTNTIGAGKEIDPTTLSADSSKIEGLWLNSDGGTIAGVTDDTKGHGIWLRARAVLIDLTIKGFPGNGLNIIATSGSSSDAREGNANNWVVERARITGCHQHGIYVDGADVNSGFAQNVDVSSNGRWGIFDTSFLGNTYIGCHASNNGLATIAANGANDTSFVHLGGVRYAANVGATEAQLVATTPGTDENVWYDMGAGLASGKSPTWLAGQPAGTYFHGGPYHSDGANARNVFTGNYTESGQGPSQWVTPTTVFGGSIGTFKGTAVVHTDQEIIGKIEFSNHRRFTPARDLTLTVNASVNKLLKFYADGDHSSGMSIVAWSETDGHVLIGEHANASSRRPIRITTNLNTTTCGRTSALIGGEVILAKGVFLGTGVSNTRHMTNGTAAPASGEHARGEIVWKRNISVGQPMGWMCTVAGTPGTWVAMANL